MKKKQLKLLKDYRKYKKKDRNYSNKLINTVEFSFKTFAASSFSGKPLATLSPI